jgi:N-acetylglucosamine-6-phosphate deacetylase
MPTKIAVKNIFTQGKRLKHKSIEINNGVIQKINDLSANTQFDFENLTSPLVDIHINGGENFHFTKEPTSACLNDIETSARKNGVGYLLPTVITSDFSNIFKAISETKVYLQNHQDSGILGIHVEGPFINPIKRGAHLLKYIKEPNDQLINELIKSSNGIVKLLTIAPELFTNEQIDLLLKSNICISAGHSNATCEEATHSFNRGINLVTHLFNAMSVFNHRSPGLIGASLLHKKVYTPIILDGIHCSWDAAALAYKIKKDKLILISDALFQNHKKMHFQWEEFDAIFTNNQYINSEGNLAGAAISMADAVKNAVTILGIPLEKALKMASENPLKNLKLNRKIGSIVKGYEANFLTFNNNLENISLIKF